MYEVCPECGHAEFGVADNPITHALRRLVGMAHPSPRCGYEDEASGDIMGGPACYCRHPFHVGQVAAVS